MWCVCTCNTCVVFWVLNKETGDAFCVGLVPLDFSSTNSSPLYAPPPPLTILPPGSPSLKLLRTAYARGCGAEAAARVGAWAGLGCTQCKAAGDWPSAEGKEIQHSPEVLGLHAGQACVRVMGQKTFCLALLLKSPTSHQKDCIKERRGKNSALSREKIQGVICVLHHLASPPLLQWQLMPSPHIHGCFWEKQLSVRARILAPIEK